MANKQVSEMSDEELAAYQEPGAEEGDWMDYLPTGGLKKLGANAVRKTSAGMLERIKTAAKAKVAEQKKTGTGNADSIRYDRAQGGGTQDYLKSPTVTQRPAPAAPTAPAPTLPSFDLAGKKSALSQMPMPAAAGESLPPVGDTNAAPLKKGVLKKRPSPIPEDAPDESGIVMPTQLAEE